uniref:N-acetyltransferase ESCO1 n=1 Tax=Caenorhabditis tropicalis TaxID=1561998 RepID=A0A1I7T4T6_9PELO
MKGSQPPKRVRIDDFFKPEKFSSEEDEEENQEQSTSADVQKLKCPKRKVLSDDETDDIEKKKRAVRKRGAMMKDLGKSQMVLDCGQTVIGPTTCKECGMVYSVDAAEDVKAHEKFHREWQFKFEISKDFSATMLKFASSDFYGYKVFYLATLVDDKFKEMMSNHVSEINKLLGYSDEKDDLWTTDKRIFLVVCVHEQRILIGGILIIEKVTKVHTNVTRKEIASEDDVNDWIVGVDRIWVDPTCRRTGVAFCLLDAATSLDRQMEFRPRRLRIAFSDPTDDGVHLAKKFIETRYSKVDQFDGEILVY